MASNLSSKGMIVSFSASQYGASKKDKEQSKQIASNNDANSERVRVTLQLVDKSEKAFTNVRNHIQQMRIYHNSVTLPWLDNGARILPVSLFDSYRQKINEMIHKANELVEDFVADWPNIMEREKERHSKLGKLWKAENYIAQSELRHEYKFAVSVCPLPDSSDFRVSLHDSEVNELKAQYEQTLAHTMLEARKEMFTRLHKVVSNFADNIRKEDKIFKQASIDNMCKLCDLLNDLNIAEDKDIEALANSIKEKLCVPDANVLRDNKAFRAEISKEADAILDSMAGYLA